MRRALGFTRTCCGLIAILLARSGSGLEQPSLSARESAAVPPALQAAIFARMLAYDRALKARAGDSVVVGITYKASDKVSVQTQADMLQAFGAFESHAIKGLPLTSVSHAYKDARDLETWISKEGVDVVYVASGFSSEVETIRALCAEKKLPTLSPVHAFVNRGLALGVVAKAGTPGLLVNVSAAQLVGMDLDPKLLQLAEMVR